MNRAAGSGFVLGMLACAGCATTRGGDARMAPAQSAVTSAAQPLSAERGPCRVTGPSQIVGWHAYVPAGLEAQIDSGRVSIVFAHPRSSCETATVDVSSVSVLLEERGARCPGETPGRNTSADERPAASPFLGFRAHASRSVELVAWIDENPEGHRLHAQAMTSFGTAVGPALALSPADASVLGWTATVMGPDGRGVVAYFASGDDGVDGRATPFACEAF
ncbi:MAG: hypothetical protein ACRENE_18295 [Polyangiaceae bacterium]